MMQPVTDSSFSNRFAPLPSKVPTHAAGTWESPGCSECYRSVDERGMMRRGGGEGGGGGKKSAEKKEMLVLIWFKSSITKPLRCNLAAADLPAHTGMYVRVYT